MNDAFEARIESVEIEDIRFRFPRLGHGSDAINPHTDYSNPYVTVRSSYGDGHGIGFSLGRGNDLICRAVDELSALIRGKSLEELVGDFGRFKWILANPVQSRWIAPNAGPYYMAGGAIMNAVFDLWAKIQNKPLWAALSELPAERIVSMIDFRYIEHYLTADEAFCVLSENVRGMEERRAELETSGLPCYFTTWIGSGIDELTEQVRREMKERGIRRFKLKVGSDLDSDRHRFSSLRAEFGDSIELFADANQVWSVREAVEWMETLAEFDVRWIEEPTAPDSITGHRRIREALRGSGIEVVTGENCPNPHIAAQLIAEGAVDRFQIDACRMMGPPDALTVMLVAQKYAVPVCPHAGGSGLDELVPHLSAWNYLRCEPNLSGVIVEQVGFCSHNFAQPSVVENGRIVLPSRPGYLVGMTDHARREYRFPDGPAWSDGRAGGR